MTAPRIGHQCSHDPKGECLLQLRSSGTLLTFPPSQLCTNHVSHPTPLLPQDFLHHICMHAKSLQCVLLFMTLWTIACQAPLSMVFSRQEYWSGLPRASLVAQMVKNLLLQCGTPRFDPWFQKMPWRREWQPTSIFFPGNSMDRGAW